MGQVDWAIFEMSLFYPKTPSIQTVLVPSFTLCVKENSKYEGLTKALSFCEFKQQTHRSILYSYKGFEKLDRIRFFDFSKLKYYIDSNISESKTCEL